MLQQWFVILFLQKLFFGRRGPLLWSLLVVTSVFLSTAGLWAAPPQGAIPYLTVGPPLLILRNLPQLWVLVSIWLAWAVFIWLRFADDERKRILSGLVYLAPLSPLLPSILGPQTVASVVEPLADFLLPNAFYGAPIASYGLLLMLMVITGFVLGFFVARLFGGSPRIFAIVVASLTAVLIFFAGGPQARASHVLFAAVLLGPLLCVAFSDGWRRSEIGAVAACLLAAAFTGSGIALVLWATWILAALASSTDSLESIRKNPVMPKAFFAAYLTMCLLALVPAASSPRIPNHRFRSEER